ncbi:hypothetical protein ANOM_009054 [Aspergillus nomiae NRRL 13137]|uniref:Uncharacterized protein n=1 Tax=Aspergillus nomiae NRRL (strain ATCC 15546 / NRRL 13137 / CBS 260.88 / M93) TaxID=1509407 RepID=A0A0L1IUT1_ASPN3|nr:uncharacterized protein ANOM_009054 [Aspergillus nomiae NRRL 13137]KNG83244.1 hypothetical protein ANOM_009054 [Aspergillus nomiae NRRL 13137]
MVKDLTFDVRYDNELAHDYYGDGKKLADYMRRIYHDKNLHFPDEFDSTLTTPPIHFMSVEASDEADLDDLRNVNVPPGLNIEIMDLDM